MSYRPVDASFNTSHIQWASIRPESAMPTAVFFGRSNVGKSTCIGEIFNRPSLVRSSRTPGRTVELLRFISRWRDDDVGRAADKEAYAIDTPGYGYAKRSQKAIAQCSRILNETGAKPPMHGVAVFLWDIRRSPTEEDLVLHASLSGAWPQSMLLLSKSDKLNKADRHRAKGKMAQAFGVKPITTGTMSGGFSAAKERLGRLLFSERTQDEMVFASVGTEPDEPLA